MKKIINQDFFSRFPAYFLLISIAQMHAKSAGYPTGGSLKFTKLLEEKYNKSGGKIHFNSKVIKVLEENDNAIGISLENGKTWKMQILLFLQQMGILQFFLCLMVNTPIKR